jgi:glutathione S-transferase
VELWHAWTCPYCMRVRIALAEKGLRYDEKEIDLARKPPELFALNPAGGVPVLVVGGTPVPDSVAILEYLEEHFPDPPLAPRDARDRKRAWLLHDRVTAMIAPHLPKIVRGNPEEKAEAERAVRAALASLENDAPEQGFLAGGFSIADIALASLVMKLPESTRPAALGLPRLARWEAAVRARPSVAAHAGARRPGVSA